MALGHKYRSGSAPKINFLNLIHTGFGPQIFHRHHQGGESYWEVGARWPGQHSGALRVLPRSWRRFLRRNRALSLFPHARGDSPGDHRSEALRRCRMSGPMTLRRCPASHEVHAPAGSGSRFALAAATIDRHSIRPQTFRSGLTIKRPILLGPSGAKRTAFPSPR